MEKRNLYPFWTNKWVNKIFRGHLLNNTTLRNWQFLTVQNDSSVDLSMCISNHSFLTSKHWPTQSTSRSQPTSPQSWGYPAAYAGQSIDKEVAAGCCSAIIVVVVFLAFPKGPSVCGRESSENLRFSQWNLLLCGWKSVREKARQRLRIEAGPLGPFPADFQRGFRRVEKSTPLCEEGSVPRPRVIFLPKRAAGEKGKKYIAWALLLRNDQCWQKVLCFNYP